VRFLVFSLVFGARLGAEFLVQPRGARRARARARGRGTLATLTAGHLISGTAVGTLLLRQPGNWAALVSGLGLLALGLAGRTWALGQLGPSYSPYVEIPAGGRLVTTGPYARIRHPLYAFYLLEMAGLLLVCPNPVSLVCLGAVAAAAGLRVREEEALLQRTFGREWADYRRHTRRLIPGIY